MVLAFTLTQKVSEDKDERATLTLRFTGVQFTTRIRQYWNRGEHDEAISQWTHFNRLGTGLCDFDRESWSRKSIWTVWYFDWKTSSWWFTHQPYENERGIGLGGHVLLFPWEQELVTVSTLKNWSEVVDNNEEEDDYRSQLIFNSSTHGDEMPAIQRVAPQISLVLSERLTWLRLERKTLATFQL